MSDDLTSKHRDRLPPMMKLLGVDLVSVEKARVVAQLKISADLGNGNGVMHGGAFMAFADHIGAIGTVVNLPRGMRTATIESKTNFFYPGLIGETLTAESVPLHIGSKTMVWQTRITDSKGRMLAQVTQTQIVMPLDRAQETIG
jgi:1,4-dihydroxy-2-naphthoyl-CoA hydrolase